MFCPIGTHQYSQKLPKISLKLNNFEILIYNQGEILAGLNIMFDSRIDDKVLQSMLVLILVELG